MRGMADWLSAFKYAARGLRRQPTFLLVALLTLSLGIGATTAIFSVIKAVVLNPLPYDAPERIVVVWEVNPEGNLDRVSVPTFGDWKKEARTLSSLAAYRQVDFSFAGTGDPMNVRGVRATPDLFTVLRASAALGRTFTADEAVVGADRVAVVSHGFWTRLLGANPAVVGTTIQLDGVAFTVAGVMPPRFEFPTASSVDVWTPLAFDPKDIHGASRRARSLTVVARLADGASPAAAQDEVQVLARRLAAAYPDSNDHWSARVVAAHDQLVAASRPALVVLMGAVGFLLLIVCANMANLLLARLSTRRREIAVRGALGAGRWEVARPILAEAVLLAAAGGALGLGVALGGLRLLRTLPESQLPRMDQLTLDGGVLAFTTLISVVVALLFGILPALRAARDLRSQMHESSGSTGSPFAGRVLGALVVAEVALALVLLVGAGLMTRSFQQLLQVSPGFDGRNVLAARVLLPSAKYQRPAVARFYDEVLERLRRAPGIRNASAVSALPLQNVGATSSLPFAVEGQAPPMAEDPMAEVRIVAPGYFETMRIPLVEGRYLDDRDAETGPRVSLINQTMARRYFPGQSPLGRTIQNPHGKSEVVGVVGDVRNEGLESEPKKQVYLPMRQSPSAGMALVARTEGDPTALAMTLQRAIWDVDPQQPIYELSTADQLVARAVFLPRLSATLLALFALAALLLAVLGIYGVLSYSVNERTKEIGLRLALGADASDTLRLVLRRSITLVAAGGALGLVASLLLTRSLSGILYGVGPFDLPSFATAVTALLMAGVLASVLPAWRTTRVDPLVTLRES